MLPGAFQVEQRGGVIGVLEHERGGLVDRHGARAGRGIGMLAGMQAQRFEGRGFRSRHIFVVTFLVVGVIGRWLFSCHVITGWGVCIFAC